MYGVSQCKRNTWHLYEQRNVNNLCFTMRVYGTGLTKTDTEGHVWQWIYTCDNPDAS